MITEVGGCVTFSSIQVSNELLTFLAVKSNHWCQKAQSFKKHKNISACRRGGETLSAHGCLYHPLSSIPPVLSIMIPFYSQWLFCLSSPQCHIPEEKSKLTLFTVFQIYYFDFKQWMIQPWNYSPFAYRWTSEMYNCLPFLHASPLSLYIDRQ